MKIFSRLQCEKTELIRAKAANESYQDNATFCDISNGRDLQSQCEAVDLEHAVVLEEVGHRDGDGQLLDVAVDELEGNLRVLKEGVDVRGVEGHISELDRAVDRELVEEDAFVEKRTEIAIDQILANSLFEGIGQLGEPRPRHFGKDGYTISEIRLPGLFLLDVARHKMYSKVKKSLFGRFE